MTKFNVGDKVRVTSEGLYNGVIDVIDEVDDEDFYLTNHLENHSWFSDYELELVSDSNGINPQELANWFAANKPYADGELFKELRRDFNLPNPVVKKKFLDVTLRFELDPISDDVSDIDVLVRKFMVDTAYHLRNKVTDVAITVEES